MYIIGAGQLGSRHLQGLSIINQDVEIIVIDPNSDALELAQKRYEEMPSNSHVRSVNYHRDIPGLDGEVDLAILATNAENRREIIENLLYKVRVNYLILEKVVFQSVKDFEEIILILEERKIKAWVNCPRRICSFFQELRKETILSDSIKICVKGSSWGLASNTIHMLDIFSFLSGQTNINIDYTDLDDEIYKSKRDGFVELGGRILAKTDRGDILELVDDRKQDVSSQMSIKFNGNHFEIVQNQSLVRIFSQDGGESNEIPFNMPLQSNMTADVAEQILETGLSNLTPLNESYLLHRPMLDTFNAHLSTILNRSVTICPIT
jgi:hypothetical protein